MFVLSAKGITCTGIWNSDLEMIVYVVFSCILENHLFVKIFLGKSVCLCPFQCQFVALNNNDHGMANWFNQRPNGKDWIVSLNGQHLYTTGECNHCSEHFWSWMLAVFSHCLVRVLSEFISFCGRKLSLQPQVLQIYTKSLWGFTVCLSFSIAGIVSNR